MDLMDLDLDLDPIHPSLTLASWASTQEILGRCDVGMEHGLREPLSSLVLLRASDPDSEDL